MIVFTLVEARNWCTKAKCKDLVTGDFYPKRGEAVNHLKMVCRVCPVVKPCLEYAMRNRERFGIWGGTSERERRKMRAAQALNKKEEKEVSITKIINQFGINLTLLKERELEGWSGKDGYK